MSIRRKGLFLGKSEDESGGKIETISSNSNSVILTIDDLKNIIKLLGGDPGFLDNLEETLSRIENEIRDHQQKIEELQRKRTLLLNFRKRLTGK